jgi:DNA-3-methyladenine glycosylase
MRNFKLTKDFYNQSTLSLAKNLLGKTLVHATQDGITSGIIVETEAYLLDDEASHSFRGETNSNKAMFQESGTVYVYFIYGNYFCFNVVSNKKGIGEAILIRALEPVEGVELMRKRRKKDDLKDLCSGPGKLCIAMDIDKSINGEDLIGNEVWIEENPGFTNFNIVEATRIGISKSKEELFRFYVEGSEFVSRS